MGPVGPWELIIILAVAILLFGPSRFSGLGRAAGNMMREFREALGPDERKNSADAEVGLKKS